MSTAMRLAGFTAEQNGKYSTRRPLSPEQILKAAKTLAKRRIQDKAVDVISDPHTARLAFQAELEHEEREVFVALFLTSKNAPITLERLFYGTINQGPVYPREIVKRALSNNAAAVIVAHNHPSGDPTPSGADAVITRKIKKALDLIDVRLLDHIVIGRQGTASLVELGLGFS